MQTVSNSALVWWNYSASQCKFKILEVPQWIWKFYKISISEMETRLGWTVQQYFSGHGTVLDPKSTLWEEVVSSLLRSLVSYVVAT